MVSLKTRKWLNQKIKIELTRHELYVVANAIADASRCDASFTCVPHEDIRRLFKKSVKHMHKIWLKIMNYDKVSK